MRRIEISNNWQDVEANEYLKSLDDIGKIESLIISVLDNYPVIEEKIYVYQTQETSDYIVFEVQQPDLESEYYVINILVMSVFLEVIDRAGYKVAITADVNHLMFGDVRYTAW